MTIALSAADYTDLWDWRNPSSQSKVEENSESIFTCPDQLGSGRDRSIELRGISLLLIDLAYHGDLKLVMDEDEDRFIEFGFNLAGTFANRSSKDNFLPWGLSADRIDREVENAS